RLFHDDDLRRREVVERTADLSAQEPSGTGTGLVYCATRKDTVAYADELRAAAPASLDAYYQEIGRAGRDGDPAEVVLLHHASDLNLQRFLTARRPKP